MDSRHIEPPDPTKHCQADNIRICTRCGSINVKIEGYTITCNDCNAVLCYEHNS